MLKRLRSKHTSQATVIPLNYQICIYFTDNSIANAAPIALALVIKEKKILTTYAR